MKVLFISHSAGFSGAERCYHESVISLLKLNIEVICVVPAKEGDLIKELEKLNVKIYFGYYNWWMVNNPIKFNEKITLIYNFLKTVFSFLVPIIKLEKPDIIITNTQVVPVGAFAAKLTGRKHIWYIHEFGEEDHLLKYVFGRGLAMKIIDYFSATVLVNSEIVKNKFIKYINPKKIKKINYAIDGASLHSEISNLSTRNAFLQLLLPGRVAATKRQEDAVLAMKKLVAKGLDIKLTILGANSESYTEYIRKLIANSDLEKYINLVGFTSEPIPYFLEADAILMCSTNEAFGRVTVEAMKLGKPVIGANGGATPEIINNKVNGLLYEPLNVEDLASQIEYLYHNRDDLMEMGLNARIWSTENFNFNKHGLELKTHITNSLNHI